MTERASASRYSQLREIEAARMQSSPPGSSAPDQPNERPRVSEGLPGSPLEASRASSLAKNTTLQFAEPYGAPNNRMERPPGRSASELREAAVDGDLAGGHEAAVLRREKGGHGSDLRRVGHALERSHRGKDLLALLA